MRVLLCKSVPELGEVGDVVEVKPGYARNYLIPQGLANRPTEENLKAVEKDKARRLAELAKRREEVEARAEVVRGREITISARANEEGHLYGSLGPAQICAALAEEGVFIEPELVHLEEPIRRPDKYDVQVVFAENVTATIHAWVVRLREEGETDADAPNADPAQRSWVRTCPKACWPSQRDMR